MYENLINETIDKTNPEFGDFPSSLEGEIFLGCDSAGGWLTKKNLTALELEERETAVLLKAKKEALASITVTTSNGNTFDGDDVARADMLSAIEGASFLGLTEKEWKLADNSWKLIQLSELREASALAIIAKGQILAG